MGTFIFKCCLTNHKLNLQKDRERAGEKKKTFLAVFTIKQHTRAYERETLNYVVFTEKCVTVNNGDNIVCYL